MRKIGRMGERFFGIWCDSVDITANSSEVDETGWDFFIEFPYEPSNSLPRDMLPAPIECRVQVKSTDQGRKKESITVSNLRRFVQAPIPAFFCFIEFDGKNEPQAAYLVHVDRKIIKKTLKRIRELEIKDEGNKLNNHKINICYGDANRLTDTTGESLKRAIEKYIPDTLEKYIEDKNKLLKALGFEDGVYQGKVVVSGDDPIRDIDYLELGIRKQLIVDRFTTYHTRFGIPSNNPYINRENVILSIQSTPKQIKLRVSKDKFSLGVFFTANVYSSSLNKLIPERYPKLRIESDFFDCVFEAPEINFLLHIKASERSSLSELKSLLWMLKNLKDLSNSLTVNIVTEGLPLLPVMQIEPNDLNTYLSEININGEVYSWSKTHQIAETAISICKKLNISEDDVLISLDELVGFAKDIAFLYQTLQALDTDPMEARIEFPAEGKKYQQGMQAAFLTFVKSIIGDHTIAFWWGLIGSLTLSSNQYIVTGERFLIWRQLVESEDKNINQERIKRELDELKQELEREGIIVLKIMQYLYSET